MEALAVAIAIVAGLAWDIARRALKPVPIARIEQVEKNQQALASDLHKTDKVAEELAKDWRAKFDQLDAQLSKLQKEVSGKPALPAPPQLRGYNRP